MSVGAFQSNCHLVRDAAGGAVVIVDPGAEPERIAARIAAWDMEPAAILLTHAHLDHIGGVGALVDRFGIPVYLHPDDLPIYEAAPQHAAMFGLRLDPQPAPDRELRDGQRLAFGDLALEVRHAPGHSPGGVVLAGEGLAFVGDCVFAGSIGRTDLPGGDARALLASIRERILTLPGGTILHTGHGPATTVAREAASNPFLAGGGTWA
ncbi:MAG: MBL fold metallo-hydrolase [Gemmatimonadota bacterium]|nr:MBL fold metallo-hydrolase [Gemmatimonadota bacterium]